MTALTGETGAGKTLVVEAIELLLGGRAEGVLVRPGAAEALVEGRFVLPTGLGPAGTPDQVASDRAEPQPMGAVEVVLSRVVPADGRSRAYLDGRMASVGALAELGERLVDLHGQHAHQSLLAGAAQRDALDSYAGADLRPREAARAALREIDEALARAGRDGAGRSGEMELLRYQLAELSAAQIEGPEKTLSWRWRRNVSARQPHTGLRRRQFMRTCQATSRCWIWWARPWPGSLRTRPSRPCTIG